MEITQVKVFPVEEERLKAYVSIVLDDCFLVSDLKVIQGPNGVFVSMPSKRKKNGEFKDIAHPLNRETRERMEKIILAEYERIVRSPSFEMKLPSVVSLKSYVRPARHPAFTRFNVFLRDRFECQYCGAREELRG